MAHSPLFQWIDYYSVNEEITADGCQREWRKHPTVQSGGAYIYSKLYIFPKITKNDDLVCLFICVFVTFWQGNWKQNCFEMKIMNSSELCKTHPPTWFFWPWNLKYRFKPSSHRVHWTWAISGKDTRECMHRHKWFRIYLQHLI